MKIIDISPVISSKLGVFPGDTPFRLEKILDTKKGDIVSLSKITTTMHLGAHVDAPYHYSAKGKFIHEVDLQIYNGLCQIISLNEKIVTSRTVKIENLKTKNILAQRVIIKTNSFPDPNHWNSNFFGLSVELIQYLKSFGVFLVGIDTPSMDIEESKSLEVHHSIFDCKINILEGVVLSHVNDGLYKLSCTPLNILNGDASAVRAFLYDN